jgi:hypothetical protein
MSHNDMPASAVTTDILVTKLVTLLAGPAALGGLRSTHQSEALSHLRVAAENVLHMTPLAEWLLAKPRSEPEIWAGIEAQRDTLEALVNCISWARLEPSDEYGPERQIDQIGKIDY